MDAELARKAAEEIVAVLDRLDAAGIPVYGVDSLDKPDKNVIIGDPNRPGHVQIRRGAGDRWIRDEECCHWDAIEGDPEPVVSREWLIEYELNGLVYTETSMNEDTVRAEAKRLGLEPSAIKFRDITSSPWRRLVTGHGEDS